MELAGIHARESGHDELTAEQLTAAHERLVATNPHPTIEEVVASTPSARTRQPRSDASTASRSLTHTSLRSLGACRAARS